MEFKARKASKKKARGRAAIDGPTGSGKTYTAIKAAKLLIREPFKLPDNVTSRVCVIDTERNSAENYEDEFDFSVIELPPEAWNPVHYMAALRAAEKIADAVVLDSISHEWAWCLQEVDRIQPRFKGNKWAAWSEIRPPHDNFIDAMMGSSAHIFATIRTKMATVADKVDGKTTIREVGMEDKQDDQIKYAFSIVLRMDEDHNGIITKTRCKALDKAIFPLPGEDFATAYLGWLESGVVDNKVADGMEGAIALAVERERDGVTDARAQLSDWCRAKGKSKEEHAAAQDEVTRRVGGSKARVAIVGAASAPDPVVDGEELAAAAAKRATTAPKPTADIDPAHQAPDPALRALADDLCARIGQAPDNASLDALREEVKGIDGAHKQRVIVALTYRRIAMAQTTVALDEIGARVTPKAFGEEDARSLRDAIRGRREELTHYAQAPAPKDEAAPAV